MGIMLAANDSRARSLLDDISQVTLTTNPPTSESLSVSAFILLALLGSTGVRDRRTCG